MFELNENFYAPMALALVWGIASYWDARKSGMPIVPALNRMARNTLILLILHAVWWIALNALHVRWASFAGFALGLGIALAWLLLFFLFQSLRPRPRNWR